MGIDCVFGFACLSARLGEYISTGQQFSVRVGNGCFTSLVSMARNSSDKLRLAIILDLPGDGLGPTEAGLQREEAKGEDFGEKHLGGVFLGSI